MNARQRGLFWSWLTRVLAVRLGNPGYVANRVSEAANARKLLDAIHDDSDFSTVLPLILSANIPGFK